MVKGCALGDESEYERLRERSEATPGYLDKVRRSVILDAGSADYGWCLGLEILNAVRDIDVFISGHETQEKDLVIIRWSCQGVLEDCQQLLAKYSSLESPARGLKWRTKRAWEKHGTRLSQPVRSWLVNSTDAVSDGESERERERRGG
ncbi:hypothetical protein PG994_004210 [Apiospora phragmitis]|uniref:Uncharacterized protein n=1 Tax=Apiospora phragmitis TaxID=2905665 RepID=A0ABR1VSM4_9PEZI